jgi:pilus assembly protein Flp/PilA
MQTLFSSQGQKGQGLVEYALILVLVAIVVIAALMVLGPIIGNVFTTVNSSLSTVAGGGGDGSPEGCTTDFTAWCTGIGGTPVCDEWGDVCYTSF